MEVNNEYFTKRISNLPKEVYGRNECFTRINVTVTANFHHKPIITMKVIIHNCKCKILNNE